MGIEQQIDFDFTRGEKVELLGKYNITATDANIANLEQKDSIWLYKGEPIEVYAATLDELYSNKDKNW